MPGRQALRSGRVKFTGSSPEAIREPGGVDPPRYAVTVFQPQILPSGSCGHQLPQSQELLMVEWTAAPSVVRVIVLVNGVVRCVEVDPRNDAVETLPARV